MNQVADIMLKYLETQDWGQTFAAVIPQRKVAGDKGGKESNARSSEEPPAKRHQADKAEAAAAVAAAETAEAEAGA